VTKVLGWEGEGTSSSQRWNLVMQSVLSQEFHEHTPAL